jgi:23S rRNA pseudouridine2605 synthase
LSDSPSFTPQQLAAARAAVWHQNGEPILTQEGMQDWVAQLGLVLYTPRPLQMPAPAPSFAEAAHGSTNPAMSLEQMEPSRELLQRLIAGNHAVALNLLGTLGETPDYIVSAQALAFVFTLRGDKNWKKAPTSGGANKVSPLAVRVYELLAEHGALNTRDLIVHAGREVTEAAVLRALGELWSQLRVFPQLQGDGAQTLWELASVRYTKQLKAGSNAGVPTALSALISLYLGAVIAATTEEIEIFLSPLASRSRIREVVHGLMSTRQLEERVVEGKTLLHLVSGLPVFAPQFVEPRAKSDVNPEDLRSETETPAPGFTPRISKFAAGAKFSPRAGARPAGKSFGDRKPFGDKKPFGKPDRERRPFAGSREGGAARPPRRDFSGKAGGGKPSFGDKRPFTPRGGSSDRKPFSGEKKSFGGTRPSPRRDFGGKPDFTKPWEEEKKARPRPDARAGFDAAAEGGATGGHATPRYPRFDDRKPGAAPKREYKPRTADGDSRPPRRDFGGKPSFGGKPGFGAKKSFGDRPPRKEFGDKPAFKPRGDKPASAPRTPFLRNEDDNYVPSFGLNEGGRRPSRFGKVTGEKKSYSSGVKNFAASPKKFGGPKKSFGPKKFGDGEARGPKQFGEAKKFERKGPGARIGAPKKFGGASKTGGGKKFGAGPSKFGAKKKYDSGKGKPRPQGAPRKKKEDAE